MQSGHNVGGAACPVGPCSSKTPRRSDTPHEPPLVSFRIGHAEHPNSEVAIDRRRYVRVPGTDEVVHSVNIVDPEPDPRPEIPEPVLPVDAAVEPDFAVASRKIDIADDPADRGSCDHRLVGHSASHVWTVRDPVFAEIAVAVFYPGDLEGMKDRILLIVSELHWGLPSRHLTFIVSLDSPVELIASPDPVQSPSSFQGFARGLHTRAALIRHDGNEHGMRHRTDTAGGTSGFRSTRCRAFDERSRTR